MPVVLVNDKMQRKYRYELSEPEGQNFDPEFRPQLTMIAACSSHGAGRHLNATIKAAGSDLVLAAGTVAMAEPAAARGLVAPASVEVVRGRQPKA